MKILLVILFISSAWLQFSFLTKTKKEDRASLIGTPIRFVVPKGFPQPVYQFKNNTLTKEGFELGRFLFYDGKLSRDGNFPCASCHQQFAAFATFEHRLSHGYNNQFSYRNAPGLFNVAWEKELHWDGGINHIEIQPLAPITNPHEMAEDLDDIIRKLKKDSTYHKLFKAAYGDPGINSQRILRALAQFTASLVSANSKYDRVMRGEDSFSSYEQPGYQIFQQKCSSCHREPLFTDLSYRNTGISVDSALLDYGRMRITGNKTDSLKFKVPSLRNVFLTGPYGHDGRFPTISSMLDHYNSGVINSLTLDPLLKHGIPLSNDDKFYLIAFLGTLTDTSFVNDKRFSAPESVGEVK
ncbi:MAG: cytochrome-c peroxidase [Bacteroidetes bacterium]|nr:MAG: cytochrome-c peroxidase [Bacteroidota bacterium]